MSEKRLTYVLLANNYYQIREVDDEGYCRRLAPTRIIDLLNEQQATIQSLKEENEQLKQRIALFEQQEDEFEEATAQTIQNMIANYRDD